jgi:predicted transcriptional regulator
MEKMSYAVKISPNIREKVRNFCDHYGIKQGYFVEKALKEKLEREETVQDTLELKRWKYQEPQAIAFEEYLKQRNA